MAMSLGLDQQRFSEICSARPSDLGDFPEGNLGTIGPIHFYGLRVSRPVDVGSLRRWGSVAARRQLICISCTRSVVGRSEQPDRGLIID